MRKRNGFTLIELLVVIAILAILAAVAVGIYKSFIKTGIEVDPVSVLMQAATAQEQYYADHGCYATNVEDLSGFDDGSKDNNFLINADRDPRRQLYVTVDPGTNCTYYKVVVKNAATSPEWQIEWSVNCTSNAPVGSCKPVQAKGSETLKKLF